MGCGCGTLVLAGRPATRTAAEKWKLPEEPPAATGGEDRAHARAGREDDLRAYETEERRVARAAVGMVLGTAYCGHGAMV